LPRRARVFARTIEILAVVLCAVLGWSQPLSSRQWSHTVLWLVLGLVAHAGEFEINRPGRTKMYLSAGFAVSAIAIAELPTAGAMVAIAFGSLTLNQIVKSARPLETVLFNRGALALCAAAGSFVFGLVQSVLPNWSLLPLIGSTVVASVVYAALSLGLLSTMIGLVTGDSFRRPWQWPLGASLSVYWNYLALGMLGDQVLTMYRTAQAVGLSLALIPLVVTYFSLRQSAALWRLYDAIVSTLVDSLDLRDSDTGGHTRRVAALAMRLGRRLGVTGRMLEDLRTAALLHDLGKIGVADRILLKPARLTEDEWREMRRHPQLGADLLRSHGLLQGAVPMIRHHQESFDGSGYPDGLSGDAIPLGARIIAVADAFMAMVDGRPYREARGATVACAEISRCAGTQFDPAVVAALEPADWEAVLREVPPVLGADIV
jgi:HD-GYP domain-containing protein (c-di-GMP phosphodiesterase class II)